MAELSVKERFGFEYNPDEHKAQMSERDQGVVEGLLMAGENRLEQLDRQYSDYRVNELANKQHLKIIGESQMKEPDKPIDMEETRKQAIGEVMKWKDRDREEIQRETRYTVDQHIEKTLSIKPRELAHEGVN